MTRSVFDKVQVLILLCIDMHIFKTHIRLFVLNFRSNVLNSHFDPIVFLCLPNLRVNLLTKGRFPLRKISIGSDRIG